MNSIVSLKSQRKFLAKPIPGSTWVPTSVGSRAYAVDLPKYSSWLKSGVTETLLLLAMYGERLKTVPSANQYADRVVRDLLKGADKSRWWSISDDLRVLAEVSPETFMAAVEDSLAQPDQPVMELFKEDGGPVMGRAYHSNLLWALETLAGVRTTYRELPRFSRALQCVIPVDGGRTVLPPLCAPSFSCGFRKRTQRWNSGSKSSTDY